MPFFFFDWTMILLLPTLALALYAQAKVKGAYNKYSQIGSAAGLTGAETARRLLRENGVVVLVPRYGIEGIVYVCEAGAKNPFTFVRPRPAHAHAHARSPLRPSSPPPTAGAVRAQDANEELLRAPGCVLRTFDKVRVRISVDSSKAHRPKLKLQITQPVLPKA